MTVFANQNTLYPFIIFFCKFPFLDKTCKHNKSHEFANEKFHANSRGLDLSNICQDLSNWQNRKQTKYASVDDHDVYFETYFNLTSFSSLYS